MVPGLTFEPDAGLLPDHAFVAVHGEVPEVFAELHDNDGAEPTKRFEVEVVNELITGDGSTTDIEAISN